MSYLQAFFMKLRAIFGSVEVQIFPNTMCFDCDVLTFIGQSFNVESVCVLLFYRLSARKPWEEPKVRRLLRNEQCEKFIHPQDSNLQPLDSRFTALPLELERMYCLLCPFFCSFEYKQSSLRFSVRVMQHRLYSNIFAENSSLFLASRAFAENFSQSLSKTTFDGLKIFSTNHQVRLDSPKVSF